MIVLLSTSILALPRSLVTLKINRMKSFSLMLLAALLLTLPVMAQELAPETGKKKLDPSRLVFGGNMGATFGDFTFIQASPQVGYMFSDKFTAGAGINFVSSTQKFRNFQGNELYRYSNSYGGLNLFARFFPVRFLVASLQPELNYNWGKIRYKDGRPTQRIEGAFVPSLLLGGGVLIPSGGRGGMLLSLQYDVVQSNRSPYGRRAFVNFGFIF